jgi:hypothetical protein
MPEATVPFTAYDVSLDRDSLQSWDLGGDGMGYAVQLGGSLDERWARCYHLIRVGSPSHARFHLDKEKKIVWFACRTEDSVSKIQPVLDALAGLVASVNEAAESQAWDEWGERR